MTDQDDNNTPDLEKPRVAFPSPNYVLTAEQEKKLTDHVTERLGSLKREMGWNQVQGDEWMVNAQTSADGRKTFLGARQMYGMIYENEMEWRRSALGGIYKDSNWTVPICRRIITQQTAKANNHFFGGGDDWLAARPEGPSDDRLSADVQHYLRYKFREGKIRKKKEKAIEIALYRGEAVMKSVPHRSEDIYTVVQSVMIGNDGDPIRAKDGDYIYKTDVFVEKIVEIAPGKEATRMVLKRDGVTWKPEEPVYEERLLELRKLHYAGPKSDSIYFKDFLCPLTAETVEDADCVAHLYDTPVSELADRWRQRAHGQADADPETTRRAIQAFERMAGNHVGTDQQSGTHNRIERPEDEGSNGAGLSGTNQSTRAKIAECYLRWDADGDGLAEHITFIYDEQTGQPIFYDHVANVTADGTRPFRVIRENPVDGRWYGVGTVQIFLGIQAICDLQVNRWNVSNSRAGRVDFWNKHAVEEGKANPNLVMNYGNTYSLLEGKTAKDALDFVNLPEVKGRDMKDIIDFYMQLATNMAGVLTANDARAAGLATSELATGINDMRDSGNELFDQILSDLEEGVTDSVALDAEVTLANMDDQETFTYMEGQVEALETIDKERIGSLKLNVQLTVTAHRQAENMKRIEAVIAIIKAFYVEPPIVQQRIEKEVRKQLSALGAKDVEETIQAIGTVEQDAADLANGGALPLGAGAGAEFPQGPEAPGEFGAQIEAGTPAAGV